MEEIQEALIEMSRQEDDVDIERLFVGKIGQNVLLVPVELAICSYQTAQKKLHASGA